MNTSTDTSARSPWPVVAGTVALLTLIISALLTAFAWPAVRSSVQDIPIAVAGPAPAVAQVTAALDQRVPGGFDVTAVADTAAAESLIRSRDAYGAIDLSAGTPQVLTASAGSPAVAQALQGVAAALSQAATQQPGAQPPAAAEAQPATAVTVRDVVALPADDPRGAGLAAGALPLVLGGILAAVLLTSRVRGIGRRVVGALAFAVTGGLAMAAILQFWLGSIDGSYLANSGAVALTVAATSLTLLGLESLLGMAGFGLGAATMMLLGNPLSGTATAPQMLPGWSGELGQLLPPGAGGSLLRSTAFFDGAGAAHSLVVLSGWLLLGLALTIAGGLKARRNRTNARPTAEVADGSPAAPVATQPPATAAV